MPHEEYKNTPFEKKQKQKQTNKYNVAMDPRY